MNDPSPDMGTKESYIDQAAPAPEQPPLTTAPNGVADTRGLETLKMYAQVLESMVEGVSLSDEAGVIRYTNPAEDRMFGYEPGELVGQHVSVQNTYLPEENLRIVNEVIEQLKTRGYWSGEFSNRKKDGTPFVTFARITSIEAEGQHYWVCVQEDITERKKADEALKRSSAQFEVILGGIADGITVQDRTGRLIYANDAAVKVLGYASQAQLLAAPITELVGKFDLIDEDGELMSPMQLPGRQALAGEESPDLTIGWRLKTTGEVRWSVVKATPVKDEQGEVQFAINIFRDITERKQAEEALKQSEREAEAARQNLYNLFMEAPALIGILRGREGVVELFNPMFRKLWGDRDVMGKPMREAFHELEGQGWFEFLEQVYDTGEPVFGREYPAMFDRDNDGNLEEVYFNFVYQAVHNAQGEIDGVAIFGVEVTDQVLARKRAEEAVQLRDDFLSVASHELKTPITAIKGYAQVLNRNPQLAALGNERVTRSLKSIVSQADRMSLLVNEMLDISRIESGHLQLTLEPMDLVAMCEEVVSQMQILSEQHAINVSATERPIFTAADRERIGQVLVNLLENALKYSPGGGDIAVNITREQDRAVVSVSDRGIGIPAEEIAHLFQRYYRAPNASSRNYGGLGLGLYISQQIVRQHGGSIWAQSQVGEGSTFFFSLPLSSPARD
ncbi:MAG: PAS domain-containing sensor histidine kinase [Chloroflexota bacterium]|nr:PAS domain-containing sensor histidine kinase [Chloroflexota bacterium]MDQ5867910.1 PAS domain-containing sensor histidine kinase [Chloroflexota bacterium]